jgi:hypothetical protein
MEKNMSRTYRKPKLVRQYGNEERYVKDSMWPVYRGLYRTKRVKKDQAEIDREQVKLNEEFQNLYDLVKKGLYYRRSYGPEYRIAEDGTLEKKYYFSGRWVVAKPSIARKYKYVRIEVDPKELENECRERFRKYRRDGYLTQTSANREYKRLTKRDLRRKNKRLCHAAKRGVDIEDYPDRKDGKKFIWSVW